MKLRWIFCIFLKLRWTAHAAHIMSAGCDQGATCHGVLYRTILMNTRGLAQHIDIVMVFPQHIDFLRELALFFL